MKKQFGHLRFEPLVIAALVGLAVAAFTILTHAALNPMATV